MRRVFDSSSCHIMPCCVFVFFCFFNLFATSAHGQSRTSERDIELMKFIVKKFEASPDCRFGAGKNGIEVGVMTVSARGLMSDNWFRHNMTENLWSEIEPMIGGLRDRNESPIQVDWHFKKLSGVKTRDFTKISGLDADSIARSSRCAVAFMLPSYSKSGDKALVALRVMPSDHGALAIIVAQKEALKWHIVAQKLFEFI